MNCLRLDHVLLFIVRSVLEVLIINNKELKKKRNVNDLCSVRKISLICKKVLQVLDLLPLYHHQIHTSRCIFD